MHDVVATGCWGKLDKSTARMGKIKVGRCPTRLVLKLPPLPPLLPL
jgi:hypothetical protein